MSDTKESVILNRLDDQIRWYDQKSQHAQRSYKMFKFTSLILAALIPVVSGIPVLPDQYKTVWMALLGALITISEGFQHVNQYQRLWITYRWTCQTLLHEKFAYAAGTGRYENAPNALALLSDRSESLISAETSKWMTTYLHDSHSSDSEPPKPPRPKSPRGQQT